VNPDVLSLIFLDPRLAQELRLAVDLRATRAAVGSLAVPAHREVPRLVSLDVQDRVEDDHPLDGR
jgi:hypothetical protein